LTTRWRILCPSIAAAAHPDRPTLDGGVDRRGQEHFLRLSTDMTRTA
jgi:hypothetical protein